MRKKTKKFGSGGAALTGLGMGFIGSALYDKLMKKSDKDDDDKDFSKLTSVKNTRSLEDQIGSKKKEEPTTKTEPKEETSKETRDDYLAKKVPPLKTTGTFTGPDTTPPDLNYKDKEDVKPVKKAASNPAVSSSTAIKMQPADNNKRESKPVPRMQPKNPNIKMPLSSSERPYKPYPSGSKYDLEDKAKKAESKPNKAAPVTRYSKDKQKDNDSKFVPRHLRNTTPFKKGGMVKKYNDGGTVKPEPKKDTMPEWAKNERENKKRDELNKRETEGAKKEVKRNMSTFGFKHGGSASSRGDGIAQRGKTRGKIC